MRQRPRLPLRRRLRLVGRLTFDVLAVLLFAMITASMVMNLADRHPWYGWAIEFAFVAGPLYFLVRGLQSLWLTLADFRSGAYLPAQPQHR